MYSETSVCTNLLKPIIDVKLDILLLVLLRHRDVAAARLQFPHLEDSKALVLDGECIVNDIRYIIFPIMETCIKHLFMACLLLVKCLINTKVPEVPLHHEESNFKSKVNI